MLNKKFCDEHPILHEYPKYSINTQPKQVANDQLMTAKESIKFFTSFTDHTFEVIAHLLPFLNYFDFIFGLKNMTEIEGKVIIQNWNSNSRKDWQILFQQKIACTSR